MKFKVHFLEIPSKYIIIFFFVIIRPHHFYIILQSVKFDGYYLSVISIIIDSKDFAGMSEPARNSLCTQSLSGIEKPRLIKKQN